MSVADRRHAGHVQTVYSADVRCMRGDHPLCRSLYEFILPRSCGAGLWDDGMGPAHSAAVHAAEYHLHALCMLWTGVRQAGARTYSVRAGRRGLRGGIHGAADSGRGKAAGVRPRESRASAQGRGAANTVAHPDISNIP